MDSNSQHSGAILDEPMLIPREAAKLLRISERKLYSMTQAGEIPSVKIGKSPRYIKVKLIEWLNSLGAVAAAAKNG